MTTLELILICIVCFCGGIILGIILPDIIDETLTKQQQRKKGIKK